jgi:hypothetical protein
MDRGMALDFGAADNPVVRCCFSALYFFDVICPYVGGAQATTISVILFSIIVITQSLGILANFEAAGIASEYCPNADRER